MGRNQESESEMRKTITAIGAAAATAALVAGCATPQYDDLKNVSPVYPDYAVVIMNVDGFPNITLICYDGKAEITTTRDYTAITYSPQFNDICQAHKRNDITAANGVIPPDKG